MTTRLEVTKTYKLFINGQFPRTESGRSISIPSTSDGVFAHTCHASRKDLRDAVVAARAAQDAWQRRAAYNRGQILYRLAEMLEGKKQEFAEAIDAAGGASTAPKHSKKSKSPPARRSPRPARPTSSDEVAASIDRLVAFAGWADKFQQVLGSNNPVSGPYYNYSSPEPTGVVAVVAPPRELPLLALISLIAPPLCAGNTIVALACESNPIPACILGEVAATSDVPPGVINLLTGLHAELIPHIAGHRDIDAVHAANLPDDQARALREGAAENVKRVTVRALAPADWLNNDLCASPWWIERFVEIKTIWHPAGA
ncbi:MAG: aldehyde dehydrogenase family protein [Phycisphaerae bacterium]|nr:aldehyde dehydrogenase family protein [Phycisphaerae bacterium]